MENQEKNFKSSLLSDCISLSGLPLPQTWDKYTNQRVLKLHPYIRYKFVTAINDLDKIHNIQVRLTDGLRTNISQDKLYGYSRTKAELKAVGVNPDYAQPNKPWRTNAIAGKSFHNYGLAGDIVQIKNKKALYKSAEWNIISTVFKNYGFDWMFDLIKKDKPHFQMTFGYSYTELKELKQKNKIDEKGYVILK